MPSRSIAVLLIIVGACSRDRARSPAVSPTRLVAMLESVANEPRPGPALLRGVAELCGKACACLGAGNDAVEDALVACATTCPAEARAAAAAASRGHKARALAERCRPETLGLPTGRADRATTEWLAVHVAGHYLADQTARAGTERAAVEAAMAKVRIRVAPPAIAASYELPAARQAQPLDGQPDTYVIVARGGELSAGAMPAAIFDASGARLDQQGPMLDAPAIEPSQLAARLRELRGAPVPPIDGGATAEPRERVEPIVPGMGKYGVAKRTVDNEHEGHFATVLRGHRRPIASQAPLILADRTASSHGLLEALKATGEGGSVAVDAGTGVASTFALTFDRAVIPVPTRDREITLAWRRSSLVVRTTMISTGAFGGLKSPDTVFGEIPVQAGAVDVAAVVQAYQAARKAPGYADRSDLSVEVGDSVTTGAFLGVLDALVAAGVSSVEILDTTLLGGLGLEEP